MAVKPIPKKKPGLVNRIALRPAGSIRRHLPELASSWLLPEYILGEENRGLDFLFASDSLPKLAELSPIVFYGSPGVGKTALSITLAANWSRLTRLRPICFSTGKKFSADFVSAIEIDDTASFRQRHRSCKMLVIDDLDSIVAKPAAQNELAMTLDSLAEQQRPVVVTCLRLPAATRGIKASLASRLSAGFSINVLPPGESARQCILEKLLKQLELDELTATVTEIAGQLDSHPLTVPQLAELVKIASSQATEAFDTDGYEDDSTGDWTIEHFDQHAVRLLAAQHFGGYAPDLRLIAKTVSRKCGVKLVDLRGSSRAARIVRARGLAMHLSRKMTSSTLQQIGQFFGGRDHSTVLHACRKTETQLKSDSELANRLREIQAELIKS